MSEQNDPDPLPSPSSKQVDEKPLLIRKTKQTMLYVSPPYLAEDEKLKYESLVPKLDESVPVDEVVGEAKDDIKGLLYYGRFRGGILYGVSAKTWTRFSVMTRTIFQFPAEAFAEKYPQLIAAYGACAFNHTPE